jgi:two-component system chemotaxis sensor kinase CheA
MTIDMSQFYQVFFEEAGEHLANMEQLLLNLDVAAPSLEDLNAIFRAAHSIKGGSGTFGFTDMTEVTHVLETLLDKLRKEELALHPKMVDAFLAAGDLLRAQLEHHQGGAEPDAEAIRAVCAELDALATGAAAEQPARRLWLDCQLPADLAANPASVDNLIQALSEVAALELEHRPQADDPAIRAWLTTRLADGELREMLSYYAFVGDMCINADGPAVTAPAVAADPGYGLFDDTPAAPVPTAGAAGTDAAGFGFFDDAPGAPSAPVGAVEEDGFGLFDDAPGRPDFPHAQPVAAGDSPAAIEGPGYGIYIDAPGGMGVFANAPGAGALATPAAVEQASAGPASPGRRASDNPTVETARAGRRESDKVVTAAGSEASSIRVAVEKVDQLINLVGELVITQAMLAEAAGQLDPARAEKLLSGIDLLSRNTRDLQESVMSIRMLPMSMVFSRFPRVIRDLAGKLGKQVDFKTLGENTELDKGLIEKITDPLTHLVRNSLDHGIETPDKRVAAGKSPKGTLTLKASHQGGNIVIEVMDDGAGLNRERILAKAREKGLAVHDGMPDHEVWQLIFAPGFSTAEQVTDVSGRGVGMDVVKKNIEGLGGKVELASSPGHGTRTVIRLPLTLAILDGMSVGVGGETFIVPLTAIVESMQPTVDDIRTMGGDTRVVHIRGEYLPFIPLAEVFGLPGVEDPSHGIVVVLEAEEGKAALFVDELLGQHQVVIKSLEANYRRVAGISGATIMGDGSVAMILDVTAVTRMGLANSHRLKVA